LKEEEIIYENQSENTVYVMIRFNVFEGGEVDYYVLELEPGKILRGDSSAKWNQAVAVFQNRYEAENTCYEKNEREKERKGQKR